MSHPPQWASSADVSTQAPLQSSRPAGQTHVDASHDWSARQGASQAPQ
jgi:hypothetical protein